VKHLIHALLALAVACDAPPAPAPPAPIRVIAPPIDAAAPDARAVALPSPDAGEVILLRGSTKRWKRDVVAFAQATSRAIAGWGTVRLDGERPIRYATLVPHGMGERGAYLLELAPHHIVELTFYYDGRTSPFADNHGAIAESDMPFTDGLGISISHITGHHHGGETLTFGLRGDELVVFEYTYTDDVTDHEEKPIDQKFPDDFACRPRCPDLATFHYFRGSQLGVSAPARSIAALVEPGPSSLPE
jgi:hypothetical protein